MLFRSGELSYLGRCDRRKMKPNRKVLQKGRAKTGLSTRQSPFQCPTKLSIDIDKHIHLNGDQNSGHCSPQSPRHSEEKMFGSVSKYGLFPTLGIILFKIFFYISRTRFTFSSSNRYKSWILLRMWCLTLYIDRTEVRQTHSSYVVDRHI